MIGARTAALISKVLSGALKIYNAKLAALPPK
jgi:hypothetical protein